MGMYLAGQALTDEQMAVLVPVMNQYSHKRMTAKLQQQMEQACLDALEEAGCPVLKGNQPC